MRQSSFGTSVRLLVGLAVVLVLWGCSGSDSKFPQSRYAQRSELVDPPIVFPDLGLNLSMPKGWDAIDTLGLAQFQMVMSNTALSQRIFPVVPLTVMSDSILGGMVYIARVGNTDDKLGVLADRYRSFLSERIPETDMVESGATSNGIRYYEYLVRSGETVNYKLLGETPIGQRFLIEYIYRIDAPPSLQSAVEASMASLKPTD